MGLPLPLLPLASFWPLSWPPSCLLPSGGHCNTEQRNQPMNQNLKYSLNGQPMRQTDTPQSINQSINQYGKIPIQIPIQIQIQIQKKKKRKRNRNRNGMFQVDKNSK